MIYMHTYEHVLIIMYVIDVILSSKKGKLLGYVFFYQIL